MHKQTWGRQGVGTFVLALAQFALGCGTTADDTGALCPANDDASRWGTGTRHEGAVDAAERWTASTSPHRVVGTLEVNAPITIDPCAVVLLETPEGGGSTSMELNGDGQVVAEGTVEKPILVSGRPRSDGQSFAAMLHAYNVTGEVFRFVHTTIEGSGSSSNANGSYLLSLDGLGERGTQVVHVDHVTLRDGHGGGVFLSSAGVFSASSSDLTVTGMRSEEGLREGTNMPLTAPIHFSDPHSVAGLPSGNYTGNAVDHVAVGVFGAALSEIHEGTHSWRDTGVPYFMRNPLCIGACVFGSGAGNPTLSLEAGVALRWPTKPGGGNQGGIDVGNGNAQGTLLVKGTADRKVTMSGVTNEPGSWHGIQFFSGGDSSRLDHLVVRNTGGESSAAVVELFPCAWTTVQGARFAVAINWPEEKGKLPDAAMIRNTTILDALTESVGILRGFTASSADCDSVDFLASGSGNEVQGLETLQSGYVTAPEAAPAVCCK